MYIVLSPIPLGNIFPFLFLACTFSPFPYSFTPKIGGHLYPYTTASLSITKSKSDSIHACHLSHSYTYFPLKISHISPYFHEIFVSHVMYENSLSTAHFFYLFLFLTYHHHLQNTLIFLFYHIIICKHNFPQKNNPNSLTFFSSFSTPPPQKQEQHYRVHFSS